MPRKPNKIEFQAWSLFGTGDKRKAIMVNDKFKGIFNLKNVTFWRKK